MTRILVKTLLLTVFVFSLAAAAFGGSYQIVSFTGGNASWWGPYVSNSSPYNGSGGTRGFLLGQFKQATGLSFSGPMTATFKWVKTNPNDPYDLPPSSVICYEKTTALLTFNDPTGVGTYTVDDGIDSPVTGSASSFTDTLNGTRVTQQSGSTITLTCQPQLKLSMTSMGIVFGAVVSYSVDLVYPTVSFSGTVIDPNTGIGLAAPVGQYIDSIVSTRSVFNDINGVVTNALWNVVDGDACSYFVVTSTSGQLEPFVPQFSYSSTSDGWYYYKGTKVNGSPTAKPITVSVTLTALGLTINPTLTEQINLYGPIVDSTVDMTKVGPCSATLSGVQVTEDSGGIALSGDLATSPPGFTFLIDSVQLCNMSMVAGYTNVNTSGEFWLDNSYPYAINPFSDEPQFGHTALTSECVIHDNYQWTGVCEPGNADGTTGTTMWCACASTIWAWNQFNSPGWSNPDGAITFSPIIDGLTVPLQWTAVFDNIN